MPEASAALTRQVTAFVQELRTTDLYKTVGVSETLDWVAALVALDRQELDRDIIEQTLGIVLKNQEDIQATRGERVQELLNRSQNSGVRSQKRTGGPSGASRSAASPPPRFF